MNNLLKILVVAIIVVCATGFSLLLTAGIFKLICLCFGLTFTWKVAAGVWLVLFLLGTIFRNNN